MLTTDLTSRPAPALRKRQNTAEETEALTQGNLARGSEDTHCEDGKVPAATHGPSAIPTNTPVAWCVEIDQIAPGRFQITEATSRRKGRAGGRVLPRVGVTAEQQDCGPAVLVQSGHRLMEEVTARK